MAYYNIVDYQSSPKILTDFLHYISTIRNLSDNTVNGYYVDLRLFMRFIKLRKGLVPAGTSIDEIAINDVTQQLIESVDQSDVYEFLHFVMKDRENNANSRARKVATLRTYYKYLTAKAHLFENDPIKDIDVPSVKRALPRFLSLDESRSLLENVAEGPYYERDFCILTLFLNCGMRLSELVGINISDIRDDTIRITGKGNKERMVYLNDACLEAIKRYLEKRQSIAKPRDEDALFISRTGNRITPRRVEQIVDEALRAAGLDNKGYSAHKLRHTAATLMYRYGGADMLALKEILGHEHVSTTEIYTHISDEQLKKAATSSPLSTEKPKGNKE